MTGKTNENVLPEPGGALLKLALDDLEALLTDDGYWIHADVWHTMDVSGKRCMVCLAGAVLSRTMGVPREQNLSWPTDGNFGPGDVDSLVWLDEARCGCGEDFKDPKLRAAWVVHVKGKEGFVGAREAGKFIKGMRRVQQYLMQKEESDGRA